jgi:hypothetical protein
VIEKGIGPNDFLPIGEISAFSNKSKVSFSFTDDNPGSERIHYRLVFYQPDEMTYYSKILYFEITPDPEKSWFTAFPTIVRNGMTARVRAEKEGTGTIRIINYSGKVVYTQVVELRMGNNTILVDDPNKMPAGYYIAVMENGGKKATQKILKL